MSQMEIAHIKSARGPFSKDPVTYRARKAILATMIRLSWQAALLMCSRYKERQNNCQVSKLKTRSYWKYKGIYVTRKVLRGSRNVSLVVNYEGEKISNLFFFLSKQERDGFWKSLTMLNLIVKAETKIRLHLLLIRS